MAKEKKNLEKQKEILPQAHGTAKQPFFYADTYGWGYGFTICFYN